MTNATRRTGEPNEAPRFAASVMIRDLNAPDLNKLNGVSAAGGRGASVWIRQAWIGVRCRLCDLNGLTRSRDPGVPNFEGLPILAHQ